MVSNNSDTFSRVLTFPIWYGLTVSMDLLFLHCRTSITLLIYEWQLEYLFGDEIVNKEMRILQIFMAVKDNVSILAFVITSTELLSSFISRKSRKVSIGNDTFWCLFVRNVCIGILKIPCKSQISRRTIKEA